MMPFYLLLIFLTFVITWMGFKIIKKTGDWSFVIGIFFLYYWSLLGAWFFVYDDLTHGGGIPWGLHYHYMFMELFKVNANSDYFVTLIGYGLFIISIEWVILKLAKPKEAFEKLAIEKIRINHVMLILLCILCSVVSLILVWKQILIAAKYEESVYYITRHYPSSTYTLHQLLNQISIVSLYLGLFTFLAGEKGKYFIGSTDKRIMVGYI